MRDPDEEAMKFANLEAIARLQRVIDSGPGNSIEVLAHGEAGSKSVLITSEACNRAERTIANLRAPFDADYLFQVRHRVRR